MKRQSQNKPRLILGITGSFASGKTTVAKMFASSGAKLIDADKIARAVVKPGSTIYKRIIASFGKDILGKSKEIDRKKLSGIVFNNKNLLNRLNKIVHPEVIRIIKKQIETSKGKIIVLDAPLLIEAGLKGIVDKIIVVEITRKKQIQRAKFKTSLGRVDILKRIRSQIPQNVKSRFADFIIDNSDTLGQTRRQANEICKKLGLSLATRHDRGLSGINPPRKIRGSLRRQLWKN
jgi:dephospho-CoA kinase